MTTNTTRAVLDAAIDKFARAAIDDANALGAPDEFAAAKAAWAAIAPAITAHVEAEVTRRLAAAPGVEEALTAYGTAVYDLGYVLHRPDRDAKLRPIKDAAEATLRAALAADRERAVAEARPTPSAPKSGYYTYAVRVVITDGITLTRETDVSGLWSPELESFAGRMLVDLARPITEAERAAPQAAPMARPTPDEARRLVGEFAGAHGAMVAHLAGMPGPESGEDVAARTESARTALLRALGVEA